MDFPTASKYAVSTLNWLSPYCDRIEVTEEKDMLGAVIGRTNHCLKFLQDYIKVGTTSTPSQISPPRFISGGDREGKQCILQLPKCQLDLWFACERTFASRLLMRTGSKEHNIWFAERAQDYGFHWFPYYGLAFEREVKGRTGEHLFDHDFILPATTEADLYRNLGLDLILPENRESAWLAKNLEFGLPA